MALISQMVEPKFSLQTFHQCSNLVSVKLTSQNYLVLKSQILPLLQNLDLEHYINDDRTPSNQVIIDGKEVNNPEFSNWKNNDGLLMTWLRE